MRLTPESRAVVEAAINTLSAPHPVGMLDGPAGSIGPQAPGDTRTVEQRRGDALVDVCRRAVALGLAATTKAGPGVALVQTAAAGGPADPGDPGDPGAAVMSPGSLSVTPLGVKATVLVTIGYDDLVTRLRPGTLLGGMTGGTVLGPETIRTLACDAGIIPVLLGSNGQVLQLGSTTRAFTQAQTKALWLRDWHCTYPGCTTPATWCDAHHIRHWADGGPTDLFNGTLLCNRHHHVVHRAGSPPRSPSTVSNGTTPPAATTTPSTPKPGNPRRPGSRPGSPTRRPARSCGVTAAMTRPTVDVRLST